VKPPSFLALPLGYRLPTMVEMFGLKKPLPAMSRPSARKKALEVSTVIIR
jgi:hypothetical protein